MGSLGTGELVVIAVVALIVFGPKRLPELARKAGEILAKTREATKSVTSALDTEYDGITAPLQDLKREYDTTVKGFKDAASSVTGFSVDLTSSPPAKTDAPSTVPQPTDTEAESEAEAEPESEAQTESEAGPVVDSEPAPPVDTRDPGKQPDNGA